MDKKWVWVNRSDGKSGMEWRYAEVDDTVYIFINGTDHFDDWKHHTKLRRVEAADGVWVTKADLYMTTEIVHFIGSRRTFIAGHSWGAAIAALVVWILRRRRVQVAGFLYAPKQVGNRKFVQEITPYITAYRHRCDWVPFALPWLATFKMKVFGGIIWPWAAHMPRLYYGVMKRDGFR